MAFYVEKPGDEYGNIGYFHSWTGDVFDNTYSVIEAEQHDEYRLQIVAPTSFAAKWPTVSKKHFAECTGPARPLTYEEYLALIASLGLSLPSRQVFP